VLVRLGLAIALILCTGAGVLANGPQITQRWINADTVFAVAFYQDLFVHGFDIHQWNLKPAPDFFPEMPLAFGLLWLLDSNLSAFYVAYPLMWMLLVMGATAGIARHLVDDFTSAVLAAAAATAWYSALMLDPAYGGLAANVLVVGSHGAAFLMTVWLIGLVLGALRKGTSAWRMFVISVLLALTIVSDFLIVPWFVLPVSLALTIFGVLKWHPWSSCLRILASMGTACAVSFACILTLQANHIFDLRFPWTSGNSVETFVESATNPVFLNEWLALPAAMPALLWVCLAWLLACSVFLLRAYRAGPVASVPEESQSVRLSLFLILFSLLSFSAALAGPILKGFNWIGAFRYLHPVFLLPTLVLAILAAVGQGPRWIRLQGVAAGAILLFAMVSIAPDLGSETFAKTRARYPERLRCLDALAQRRGMSHGFTTNYWDNKFLTVLSRSGLRVNLLSKTNLSPWQISNNAAWYHRRPGGEAGDAPRHEFLIAYTPDIVASARRKFGREAALHSCPGASVLLYDRETDVSLRNRARLPGAFGRGGRRGPDGLPVDGSTEMATLPLRDDPSGIVCAREHRLYVEDGAAPNAPATVRSQGRLTSSFEKPVRAEVLEVSARARDIYDVDFYLDGTALGQMRLPRVPGKGMQIRYLSLPARVAGQPLDQLVFKPQGGTKGTRVGHLCLYNDAS